MVSSKGIILAGVAVASSFSLVLAISDQNYDHQLPRRLHKSSKSSSSSSSSDSGTSSWSGSGKGGKSSHSSSSTSSSSSDSFGGDHRPVWHGGPHSGHHNHHNHGHHGHHGWGKPGKFGWGAPPNWHPSGSSSSDSGNRHGHWVWVGGWTGPPRWEDQDEDSSSSSSSSPSGKSGKSGGSGKSGKSGGYSSSTSTSKDDYDGYNDGDGDDDTAHMCGVGASCPYKGAQCTEGTESCCGEKFDALVCECAETSDGDLEYVCYNTDACFAPWCEETCDVGAPCPYEGAQCTEGTETCCGETFDSLVCDCTKSSDDNLEYMCYSTDACFAPWCEETCGVGASCPYEGVQCTEGTETCCGETFDSLVCECTKSSDDNLEYMCYSTDACYVPWCEDTNGGDGDSWDGDGWTRTISHGGGLTGFENLG